MSANGQEQEATRTYLLRVVVAAPTADELPPGEGLAAGIADGLPEAWFDAEDGDAFYIRELAYVALAWPVTL